MEEKLYFKPASYGKGTKKKQTEKKPDSKPKTEEKKNHRAVKLVSLLLFLLIVVGIIIWLLRGKTTVSGQFPGNVKNESLECNIANRTYEKTNRIRPAKSETKITMIFYGADELNSINLRYTMHLSSSREASEAEAIAHVQFAETLADYGLNYLEFDNKFTRIDSDLTLSLYNNGKLEKKPAYEFFLVDEIEETGDIPASLTEFRTNYESKGFTCKSSIDK